MIRTLTTTVLWFLVAAAACGDEVLVEAEGFEDRGGWTVDQQSMDVMGSPYLLAHGLGTPVADAVTKVALPRPGRYRVWVRTKDWVARWGAPGTPGRFQLLIDGQPLETTFGTQGADWFWHDGGTVTLDRRQITLALHDLTGFEGRCDAVLLTDEMDLVPPNDLEPMTAWRRKLLGVAGPPQPGGTYDLVVVGGGVAGCCAAVSAARLGLTVALIQDRPVLGGNSSSEVRVWIGGKICQPPYPVIGEIVAEMFTRPEVCPGPAEAYGDDLKMRVVTAEKNVSLFLWEHVNEVETEGGRITAVVAQNVLTGQRTRFAGRWFVDSTGDGTVGVLAGADYEVQERGHMGASNMWYPEDTGEPSPFPRCPWALDLTDKPFPTELDRLGKWFWESGFDLDSVADAEAIRDHNLRAMYGAWDCLKNVKGLYPNHKLAWAAAISGKRESRRLLGDVILTKEDVLEGRDFPDGCVASTWSIDLHYPHPEYAEASPGNEFISVAKFTRFKKNPYPVPFRCLYSRNVANLMMAGRDISVTHEALGTVRVMATGGLMGEVVGRAARICKTYNCQPRDVYQKYLEEFKELLRTRTREPLLAPPDFSDDVGPNIAPRAAVTVSGDYDPQRYPVVSVHDGLADTFDNGGRWLSHAEVPNWIEFRWEKPQAITAARIISGYRSGGVLSAPLADFALEIGRGDIWQKIPETITRDNRKTDWQCLFPPATGDRIRLVVTAAPGSIARIWEIELYEPVDRP